VYWTVVSPSTLGPTDTPGSDLEPAVASITTAPELGSTFTGHVVTLAVPSATTFGATTLFVPSASMIECSSADQLSL